MLTGAEVGCMVVGGGVSKATESAPMVTETSVGVTHSISRFVSYLTRYCRNGVSSRTPSSEWFPSER